MIRNLRDLSIYTNKDGKHLKAGKFIRSAALIDLNKRDIAKLESYRPLSVIDLRTENERVEKPDYQMDAYYGISLMENLPSGIAHDKKSKEEIVKKIPNMPNLYADLIRKEIGFEGIKKVFEIIRKISDEQTVLWHCTEGKDRCGVVSALFLKLMDFDDEVIMQDYLKSDKSSRTKGRKYYWIIRLLLNNKEGAEAMKVAFSARREFLNSAFDTIIEKYGGFDGFFEAIGIDAEEKQRLKAEFLE